jgi:hypothetical protein
MLCETVSFAMDLNEFKELATRIARIPMSCVLRTTLDCRMGLLSLAVLKEMKLTNLQPVRSSLMPHRSVALLVNVLQRTTTGATDKPPYARVCGISGDPGRRGPQRMPMCCMNHCRNWRFLFQPFTFLSITKVRQKTLQWFHANFDLQPTMKLWRGSCREFLRSWSEEGKLVEGNAISSGLVDSLQKDASVSPL